MPGRMLDLIEAARKAECVYLSFPPMAASFHFKMPSALSRRGCSPILRPTYFTEHVAEPGRGIRLFEFQGDFLWNG